MNPKKSIKSTEAIFSLLPALCVISPSSVMMRRSLFDEVGYFDETLPACEDYDLWLRITKTYPVYFIETPLIMKRGRHNDQLSQKYWGIDRFRIQALEKLLRSGNSRQNNINKPCKNYSGNARLWRPAVPNVRKCRNPNTIANFAPICLNHEYATICCNIRAGNLPCLDAVDIMDWR